MQQENARQTKINSHVLDLFLSVDLSECMLYNGQGTMLGFNIPAIEREAAVFLSHLHSLGVDDLPSVSDLFEAWRRF